MLLYPKLPDIQSKLKHDKHSDSAITETFPLVDAQEMSELEGCQYVDESQICREIIRIDKKQQSRDCRQQHKKAVSRPYARVGTDDAEHIDARQ